MLIGITGSDGFIGSSLRMFIRMRGAPLSAAGCPREAFDRPELLADFVAGCDAVVHLAGLSRHPDGAFLIAENLRLTRALIAALDRCEHAPRVCFASTTHEAKLLPYHESKRQSRALLEAWAERSGGSCVTMLMPNTFGPFMRPGFNSVVPTFCRLAAQGETPERIDSAWLELIPVRALCREIVACAAQTSAGVSARRIEPEYRVRLDTVWELLVSWRPVALAGKIPPLRNRFEADLWETYLPFFDRG